MRLQHFERPAGRYRSAANLRGSFPYAHYAKMFAAMGLNILRSASDDNKPPIRTVFWGTQPSRRHCQKAAVV